MTDCETKLRRVLRKKFQGAGVEVPVGTVVIRRDKRSRSRFIKVATRGPKQERWRSYARWWWEKNRGPVPDGLRVFHKDGDTLNDSPENYILGTADDLLMFIRDWDPELDEKNRRNCAQATSQANRDRSLVRRSREWLPSRWYAVHDYNRIIINDPLRRRRDVWPEEIRVHCARNSQGILPAVLGFPALPLFCAVVVAVLIELNGATRAEAIAAATRRKRMLWPGCNPYSAHLFSAAVCALKKRGLIRRFGRRGHFIYRATPGATALRGSISTIIPVRGVDLLDERFRDYFKWTPGVNDVARAKWLARMEAARSGRAV